MANLRTQIEITASDKTKQGFKSAKDEVNKFKSSIGDLKNTLLGFFGIGFGAILGKSLIELADKWLSLNAQIRNSTKSNDEFVTAQQAIIDISRRTYTSLEANAGLFSKVNLALKAMGGNTQQAIGAVDQIAKLVALSGTSAEAAAAGIFQFTQSLAANRFSGQEYNSVAEQTPALLKAIYEGLNVNIGTLRKMAEEGALDTATVLGAIENSTKRTDAAFGKLPITFSKASQNMSNAWLEFIGRLNESKGVTQTLAQGLNFVADNLGNFISILGKLAATGGLIYLARLTQSLKIYSASALAGIATEKAALKSVIDTAKARVITKTAFLESAKAKAADAAANTATIRANLALIKSDQQVAAATLAQANALIARKTAEIGALSSTVQSTSIQYLLRNATVELTAAEKLRAASINKLSTLGTQAQAIAKQQTAAVGAQSAAQRVVTASTVSLIAAQQALNKVMTQGSIVANRLGTAMKSAVAFVGGGFGAALIGLYALYEALNLITGAEDKAEAKAALYEERLKKITDATKELNAIEVRFNLDKANAEAEILKGKIAELEKFDINPFNWGKLSAQRAALKNDLDLTVKQLDLINDRANELIANFDVSQLNTDGLNQELRNTRSIVETLNAEIDLLKSKELGGDLTAEETKRLKGLEATLSAYETKAKAINKKVADDTAKSSNDSLKKSQSKLESLNAVRKSNYDQDLHNLDQSEQSKINALNNAIPERLGVEEKYQSTKQKVLQKATLSEQQRLAEIAAIELQSNAQRLALAVQFNNQKLADTTRVFDAEIATMQSRNLATDQLERESNDAKKAILLDLEKGYEQSIAKLNALDQQHRDKAIGYLNDINQQEANRLEKLRALDLQGLNDAQATEQRKRQIAQDTAQVKKLIADGEYTKAVELGKKLQDLTIEQAQATKTAAAEQNKLRAGTGDDNAALQARNQYNASVKLTEQALQAASDAELKQANTAKTEAEKQRTALEQVRVTIADIDTAIKKANTLKITVDDSQIKTATDAINAIPKDVYVTVHQQTVQDKNGGGFINAIKRAAGGFVPGAGNTDTVPAMLTPGEFVLRKSVSERLGSSFLHNLNAGGLPHFNNGGLVGGGSSETITVNLTSGKSSAPATMNKSDITAALLNELRKQGRVS